ncbi:hypothetical protein JHK86_027274 [Glycine max]|nr:hypothetical protein JHK86_027274 [Glycine max]
MGRGKFKSKPTGRRQFSTPEDMLAGTSNRPRTFRQKEAEHEEEPEEVSGDESGEESEEETSKKKGTQGVIEIENPNLVKPKSLKARDVDCSAMEVLYRKLYDKYTRLKSNKLSDLDHLNEEQELKFRNFSSAAEELIEHLMTEKEELLGQVHHLRSELASLRAAKDNQVVDYQRLLMEETRKNEALSEEVEKLLKLRQEGTSHDLNYNSKIMTLDDQFKANYSSSVRMTRKRTRQNALEKEARLISFENDQANSVERESTENTCKETASGKESGRRNWLIQVLFEYALGMKLSTDYQTEGICLSAVHQSSGTFERVAPEWMREDIMFSPSMCPIFFERVYRVIKLNH